MTVRWVECKNCPPDPDSRAGCERKDASRCEPNAGCWKLVQENSSLHVQLVDQTQQRLQLGTDQDTVREWLAGELGSLARDEALAMRWHAGRDVAGAGVDVAGVCEKAARGIVHNILRCTTEGERCSHCRRPGCGRKR